MTPRNPDVASGHLLGKQPGNNDRDAARLLAERQFNRFLDLVQEILRDTGD